METAYKTTYTLEMLLPSDLQPKTIERPGLRVERMTTPCPEFNKFLHTVVGYPHLWGGREDWGEKEWVAYTSRDALQTWVAYVDGTVNLRQGEPANALFILSAGAVDLQVAEGTTVYRLSGESDIFGWSSLVENARYTATAIARSDIKAVKIDTRRMNRVFDANPMVGLTVYRRLSAVFNKRLASIYGRFLSV